MKSPKLESLIKKLKFNYVNPDIKEENFPQIDRGFTDFKVFHFDRLISSEDAIAEMKKEGFMPANIYEMLLWANQKNWDGKEFVVALGSIWQNPNGYRCVPCLGGWRDGRGLSLDWYGRDWGGGCRFLAVRKSLTPGPLDSPSTASQCKDKEHLEAMEITRKIKKIIK